MQSMGGNKVTLSLSSFFEAALKSCKMKYLFTKEIHHSKQRIKVTGSHRSRSLTNEIVLFIRTVN